MNKYYMIQGLDSTCAGWTDLHGFSKNETKQSYEEMIKFVEERIFNDPEYADGKYRLVAIVPLAYSKNVSDKEK